MTDEQQFQHVAALYEEAGKKALEFTPQIFIWKKGFEGDIEPVGSAVLLDVFGDKYLVTAAHCVKQKGVINKIGILDGGGNLKLISGPVAMTPGENDDQLDLAVIKLADASVGVLLDRYKFFGADQIMFNPDAEREQDYLVAGYPLTRTWVDNTRKKLRFEPLVYISKSKPLADYRQMEIDSSQNILLSYNQRKSQFIDNDVMNMAPNPTGVSGSGLWYIKTYEVPTSHDVQFFLAGIMIEYLPKCRMMIATKGEYLKPLLASLKKYNPNNGDLL